MSLYLFPPKHTLIFAFKGVIAMAMALYVSMWMGLDRPYWALVSAVFLQVRPETGMVLEKTASQITGTLVGGAFALLVLYHFHAYAEIALFCLACWLWLNAGFSSLVRRVNFIYFFAMAGVTPCIIILLSMATPATVTSETIFLIAQARVSEIIVGAVCAMLVSLMFWPRRVETALIDQARVAINQTMTYLSVELSAFGSHDQRHTNIDSTLETLITLNDDSSAVVFEGPKGPGQSRAATVICNKILSLVAVVQIFGRLQRNNPDLLSENMAALLKKLKQDVELIGSATDFDVCYNIAQKQRRQWRKLFDTEGLSPLEYRLCKTAQGLVADLVIVLRAFRALSRGEDSHLNAPSLKPYRDPLVAINTGFRTALVFSLGAMIWVGTGSPAAILLMILPVIFSIMFARLPPAIIRSSLRGVLIGAAIAVPVAIFYALNLIAQSSGDFVLLVMILAGPLFLGLMALSQRAFLPYGLGFCIPFVLLVQPANNMQLPLNVSYTASNAFAIMTGVIILYWVFKLFAGPGSARMQRRLLKATTRDLAVVGSPGHSEDWFNARMCDRLLRLTRKEQGMAQQGRVVTDLALTGLNLGHMVGRVQRAMNTIAPGQTEHLLQQWQYALSRSYIRAARGESPVLFQRVCDDIVTALSEHAGPTENVLLLEGTFQRLNMTFQRTAKMMRTANVRQTNDNMATE
nr:FUSC family protein [Aestuariibacter sp. A3R04]